MTHEKLIEVLKAARERPGMYLTTEDQHMQVWAWLYGYDIAEEQAGCKRGTHRFVLEKVAKKRKTGFCYPSSEYIDFDTFLGDVIEALEELDATPED